jgi:PAS domain S-box-containing protein
MTPADIITILGGLGSAAGTVYGFYRLVVRPTFVIIKKLRTSFEILEKMQEEFKPNGGSSLRDAINRIEAKLLIEQHARRALSMAMDVGIFETDGQGMCTWVNEYYSDLTGLTSEEAKNFGWVTGLFEDDRERVVEEWDSAVKQKRVFKLDFGMVNSRTQDYSRVHCTAFPSTNIKGDVIGFVGIVVKSNKELIRPKYIAGS